MSDTGNQVRMALKEGKLVKPKNCEDCGAETKLHGHHEDYSKPLDVIWLCVRCHPKRKKGQHYKKQERVLIAQNDPYLTIADAAKVLHIGKTWLYRKVELRQIPHRRIGHLIRFHQKDIEKARSYFRGRWGEIKKIDRKEVIANVR